MQYKFNGNWNGTKKGNGKWNGNGKGNGNGTGTDGNGEQCANERITVHYFQDIYRISGQRINIVDKQIHYNKFE